MADKIRVLLTEEEVNKKISEVAAQINKDYEGKEVHLICILKGGVFFTCELAKRLTIPVSLDFMSVSSYGSGTKSSGVVKIIKDLDEPLEGKNVIIVEDIIDSGRTLAYLIEVLKQEDQDACGQSDRQDHRHKIAILADAGGRVRNPRLAQRHLYFLHIQHIEFLPVAGGCLKNNLTGRHLAVRADLCALYGLIFQIYHELRIA